MCCFLSSTEALSFKKEEKKNLIQILKKKKKKTEKEKEIDAKSNKKLGNEAIYGRRKSLPPAQTQRLITKTTKAPKSPEYVFIYTFFFFLLLLFFFFFVVVVAIIFFVV